MRGLISAVFSTTCVLLGGCATTSFAPPDVSFDTTIDPSKASMANGLAIVDDFILKYRARAHKTANGRQYFEVPAIVTAIGGVAATAFGAGPNVAIGTGTGTALLTSGKAYYNPKAKAAIYDSALNAFLCIQQTATGVKPFTDAASGTSERAYAEKANGDGYAYYLLVRNAALNVERIASARLSAAGSLTDAEAIQAQYQQTIEKKKSKEEDAPVKLSAAVGKVFLGPITPISPEDLKRLNALQPDLELCVLRAKL